jgi:hypothetical protein
VHYKSIRRDNVTENQFRDWLDKISSGNYLEEGLTAEELVFVLRWSIDNIQLDPLRKVKMRKAICDTLKGFDGTDDSPPFKPVYIGMADGRDLRQHLFMFPGGGLFT